MGPQIHSQPSMNFSLGGIQRQAQMGAIQMERSMYVENSGRTWSKRSGAQQQNHGSQYMWKWVSNPQILWATLWAAKYEGYWPKEELIRFNIAPGGTQIWNAASQQKYLIQTHSFWELRDGTQA